MNLIKELNRRNVTRVALAYAAASWVLIEVTSVVLPAFAAPERILRVLIIMLVIGFPLALIFSWVYELTPEGIKKESDIGPEQSITGHTAKKLNVVVIILLLVAIGLFLLDRFALERPAAVQGAATAQAEVTGRAAVPAGSFAPSLAVLAFENMSADAENEYFADGISEEILNLLADISTLSVASRTSAFAFKGKDTPIPEIAAALNVRYVLEGSVRKAGEQVRVTAQLIDASTDRHLWSETFDRTLNDIFTIQDEIATSIGQALQVKLLGDGGDQVKADAVDPQAYAQFLEARHLLRSRTRENLRKANEMLIKVVGAAPDFGRAHVVLGEAYLLNSTGGEGQRDSLLSRDLSLSQAHMHAEIARMLNPSLGGIDLIIGAIAEERGDAVAAMEAFTRAVETEPSEPRPWHWRGNLYGGAGFTDECLADLEVAMRLDPENVGVIYAQAACKFTKGELDSALEQVRAAVARVANTNLGFVIVLELASGDTAAAIKTIETLALQQGEDRVFWNAVLEELGSPQAEGSPRAPLPLRNGVPDYFILLALGHDEEYQRHFAMANEAPAGRSLIWWSGFTDARRDPRFVDSLARLGITGLWQLNGPPPDCRVQGESYTCGHTGSP